MLIDFPSFEGLKTSVASLGWICYWRLLVASSDEPGSENLLECSSKHSLSIHLYGGKVQGLFLDFRSLWILFCLFLQQTVELQLWVTAWDTFMWRATLPNPYTALVSAWGALAGLTRKCYASELVGIHWAVFTSHKSFPAPRNARGLIMFFLLSQTKQQCQEKSNCFGYKNNMPLPT